MIWVRSELFLHCIEGLKKKVIKVLDLGPYAFGMRCFGKQLAIYNQDSVENHESFAPERAHYTLQKLTGNLKRDTTFLTSNI